GPVCESQSALDSEEYRCRALDRTPPDSQRFTALEQSGRAAEIRGSGSCPPGEVPAPVLGRAAPTHFHLPRAGNAARISCVRRADLFARRVGAGAGAQPHEGSAATAGLDLPFQI